MSSDSPTEGQLQALHTQQVARQLRHTRSSSSLRPWEGTSESSEHSKKYLVGEQEFVIRYGLHNIQGRRPENEDTHAATTDISQTVQVKTDQSWAYFGVYDGHGGNEASDYVAKDFHQVLSEEVAKHASGNKKDFDAALKATFGRIEKSFLEMALKNDYKSGTTAVAAIIDGDRLVVGCVGDSEVVLARNGKAHLLTEIHNPMDNPAEGKRVEKEGGIIRRQRVAHPAFPGGASLAVSRAIGDLPYKHTDFTDGKPSGVNAIPSIKEVKLDKSDQFLILACDGLWDVFEEQEAVDFAVKALEKSDDPTQVSQELVKAAYEKGSTDNITVLIVTFRHFKSK